MIRALLIGFFGLVASVGAQHWPQASGPNLNWKIEGPEPPLAWSVMGGKNILWRTTLPEGLAQTIAFFRQHAEHYLR